MGGNGRGSWLSQISASVTATVVVGLISSWLGFDRGGTADAVQPARTATASAAASASPPPARPVPARTTASLVKAAPRGCR